MRILDIINEAEEKKVYVIGDSIAVGIANAATLPTTYAVGGKNTQQVLGFVKDFIASGKAKDAVVILSSGASNSTYERPDGESKDLEVGPITSQIRYLKDAGAEVFLVGTGSKKSQTFSNKYGKYFVNFQGQQVNQKLADVAKAQGATFLGPLESYEPGLNSGKADGIHPGSAGSQKIYRAVLNPSNIPVTNRAVDKASDADIPAAKAKPASASVAPSTLAPTFSTGSFAMPAAASGTAGSFLDRLSSKLSSAGSDVSNAVKSAGTAAIAGASNFVRQKGAKNPVSPEAIKSYLASKGLDKNQVAGILANIQHESGFDSGAIGDKGTSGGLVQHHANRFASMVAASGGNGEWQKNWQAQLDYALSEPAGKQFSSLKFTSPQQAAQWWTINFEIPANKYAQANIRSASANRYA
jgi:hypothetical protein